MQEVLQEEGEEEMFFDAHEASAEEWARARRSEFMEESESLPGGGGEREELATSENTPPFNAKSMEEVCVYTYVRVHMYIHVPQLMLQVSCNYM